MKFKLIVTDYDASICNTPQPVSTRNVEAVKAFIARGGYFTIATGRMVQGIISNIDNLPTNAPIIAYQGAVMYDRERKKTIDHYPISAEIAAPLCQKLLQTGFSLNAYINEKIYLEKEYPFTRQYCKINNTDFTVVNDLPAFIEQNKATPSKLLMTCPPEKAIEFEAKYKQEYENVLSVTRSSATFLEFNHKEGTKGKAVERLAKMLGIPLGEVMCFGDSTNDLPMLTVKGLGMSVALGNAMPEVQAQASYVAPPCAADGFAQTVEKFCLK